MPTSSRSPSFCAQVDRAAAGVDPRRVRPFPIWDDYARRVSRGRAAPAERRRRAGPRARGDDDRGARREAGLAAAGRAAGGGRRGPGRRRCAAEPDAARRIVGLAARRRVVSRPRRPGLLRYLGWTVLARYLAPGRGGVRASGGTTSAGFAATARPAGRRPPWRSWSERIPGANGCSRCGCCGTRWQYTRTGCPFCEGGLPAAVGRGRRGRGRAAHRLLRVLRGYLKTYDGQGNEALLLSDWTSLHLDLIARDRGLKRLAASLYEFEPALHP